MSQTSQGAITVCHCYLSKVQMSLGICSLSGKPSLWEFKLGSSGGGHCGKGIVRGGDQILKTSHRDLVRLSAHTCQFGQVWLKKWKMHLWRFGDRHSDVQRWSAGCPAPPRCTLLTPTMQVALGWHQHKTAWCSYGYFSSSSVDFGQW